METTRFIGVNFVVFFFVFCKKILKISFATISGLQITLLGDLQADLLIINLSSLQSNKMCQAMEANVQ